MVSKSTGILVVSRKLLFVYKILLHIVGSNFARSPSPRKLIQITVTKINKPGHTAAIGLSKITSCALVSIFPHVGIGGCMPNPKKLRTDSSKMTLPTVKVVATIMGERELGRIWANIIFNELAP